MKQMGNFFPQNTIFEKKIKIRKVQIRATCCTPLVMTLCIMYEVYVLGFMLVWVLVSFLKLLCKFLFGIEHLIH